MLFASLYPGACTLNPGFSGAVFTCCNLFPVFSPVLWLIHCLMLSSVSLISLVYCSSFEFFVPKEGLENLLIPAPPEPL